jgi:hypothetical protein
VIEIRNLLFQPLTFQLAGGDRGLHLGSRQRKLVDDAQVSDEIRVAAKRGFVVLTVLEQPDQPEAKTSSHRRRLQPNQAWSRWPRSLFKRRMKPRPRPRTAVPVLNQRPRSSR